MKAVQLVVVVATACLQVACGARTPADGVVDAGGTRVVDAAQSTDATADVLDGGVDALVVDAADGSDAADESICPLASAPRTPSRGAGSAPAPQP